MEDFCHSFLWSHRKPSSVFRLEYWPHCALDPLYEPRPLKELIGGEGGFLVDRLEFLSFTPMDKHLLDLVLFASLIAPFGGFFASRFKRAFKIKDLGTSIPGHGGVVDRI